MKLVIQIPAYNEEQWLPVTLRGLPQVVPGFSEVEWLVIDDGSRDRTAAVAREHGAQHVLRLGHRHGLARAFTAGLDAALKCGADVIVNLDADNQYNPEDIPALTAPILAGMAEIVIGARPIESIAHFSRLKKMLQKAGSLMVRLLSHAAVPDAPSGFRAFSRDAAMRLNVFSEYTYTLETIIQAGQKNMAVVSVPVRVNPELRPSRLISSTAAYLVRSAVTIVRIFAVYRPFAFFVWAGAFFFGLGLLLGLRFVYFFLIGQGQGHVQSLILTAILLGMGFQTMLAAFLADLFAVNRKLLEEIQYRLRRRRE